MLKKFRVSWHNGVTREIDAEDFRWLVHKVRLVFCTNGQVTESIDAGDVWRVEDVQPLNTIVRWESPKRAGFKGAL